jgi:hypothetical protein
MGRTLHVPVSRGLEVTDVGSLVRDRLEVVDGQIDISRSSNGEEMKDRVGGASEDVHEDDGVLE